MSAEVKRFIALISCVVLGLLFPDYASSIGSALVPILG